jgi:ankyrin repeat protein
MAEPEPEPVEEGVPPVPAWKPGESSFAVKKKIKDGKKGALELEEGGKFGGKFAKWKKLHFVIRGDRLMVFENVLENEDQKRMDVLTTNCAMRLPKSERKGRPFVFRIDTTDKEKLMVDPGSEEEREAWIIEMGNAGANVPGEYADKIDAEKAEALVTRGHKKNWMNMKTPLGWKPFWFEYAMPNLTYHERPGADSKGSVDISKLELEAGPTVEAELGRDFSWRTLQRDDDAHTALPWSGLAADSKQECASWLKTLSTRKVNLVLTQAEDFGLELSDTCVVTGYASEPDGEPGPAEAAQIRMEQQVVEVNGTEVKTKLELLNLFRPAGKAAESVVLTLEGIGLPPIKEDEDEDDYLARLAAEDEERMRKEMEDEEAMAAKMEAELAARLVEEAAEKERLRVEEEERKKREEAELQEHMQLIMQLSSHLQGKDSQSTAQMLSSNMDRRLWKQGLLSAKNDEKKKQELLEGVGRSYYYLFSDMLLFVKREEKGGKLGRVKTAGKKVGEYSGNFEVERVISGDAMANANLISHAFDPDESQRRGVTFTAFEQRMYAASPEEQQEWATAFKKVLMGLHKDDPRSAYSVHHKLCDGTLMGAAASGDLDTVNRAIALSPPEALAAQDEYGATVVHLAAMGGFTEVAKAVLASGKCDVNAIDVNGQNAGHVAAVGGHTDVLDVLGAAEINFNKVDKNDKVPLGILVAKNAMTAARVVVKHGAVVDRVNRDGMAGLHDAVCRGAKDEVGRWLGLGTNPDKPVVNRDRRTPLMLAAEIEGNPIDGTDECAATIQMLLDGGANPNKPGNRAGTLVLQVLIDSNKLAAAQALVRGGARYRNVTGIDAELKRQFDGLAAEHAAEQKHRAELAKSLAELGGAAALAASGSCIKAGWATVRGTKWSRKYFVLSRVEGADGSPGQLQLDRCASDVATAPEHSVLFDPKSGSAVEFGDGQPSVDDFGLDLYGVGEAATSGAGVFGGALARMAGGEEEAGVYAWSFPSSEERQGWFTVLKEQGCAVDIGITRAAVNEERERAALMAGAAGGGGEPAAGGIAGISAVLGDAKAALTDNIAKLGDMAEQTAEMEENASDFADMARMMREKNEKKAKGLGF